MTVNDLLALTKAGFTKEEIYALTSGANEPKTNEQTKPEQKQTEVAQTQPESKPEAQPEAKQATPALTDAQVKQLAQMLNVGQASIDVPPNVSLDDKMSEHFKNLILGKE